MSKNVVFQTKKDGKSVAEKSRLTKMLRTNLQDGSICDWVPEDETMLIAKLITQDGEYKPSDEPGNFYGYSEVTVQGIGERVMGDLGVITINKNGTYYAKKAYTPQELGSSGTSSTKFGPFYGYKTVIVNVTGSSGSSGGSVTGKNADGDDVQVTVDENGQFVEKKIATRIVITKNPKFLVYHNGDTINFTGIRVTAYMGSEIYKSDKYPKGILESKDLTFTVTEARGGGGIKMNVPVMWKRPEDGVGLETSFEITVNDSEG